MDAPTQTTILLRRIDDGDVTAQGELLPIVYEELRRLAGHYMAGVGPSHTLQPTALVHEAYMRLVDKPELQDGRGHFVAVASRVMRNVLVDHARARGAAKRGGGRSRVPLDDALQLYQDRAVDLLALDEALTSLGGMDEQLVAIVELRFFGGLGAGEVAEVLDLSLRTVERGWSTARAWLRAALAD